MRRYAAAVALCCIGIGTFEPAVGMVQDAVEHYGSAPESASEVVVHSGGLAVAGLPANDPEEQHIKAFDHCMHVHGPAITAAMVDISTASESRSVDRLDARICDQTCADPQFHPPKL